MAGGEVVSEADDWFVGIQLGPISVADEGVEPLLDMFGERFGINALMLGTVSWLGLKVGRRVSVDVEGWPDHGRRSETPLKGGSFLTPRPAAYRTTFINEFRAADEELAGVDILDHVLPHSRARGIRLYIDLMEPMFNYSGHGSTASVDIPNLPQVLQVDTLGRTTSEPCLNNPDYRNWLHALVEDHCRNYAIDGIMWCNERRSPLDAALIGKAPHCFCRFCTELASREGIDVERARGASHAVWELVSALRQGTRFVEGTLVEFLGVLYRNPEALVWERFWVERNKALDRELYGIVKFCDPRLEFGLNVWNRNHLNPWRKAQWPWAEQTQWADWVKPIVYQHQTGGIFADEWTPLLAGVFRDLDPDHVIELAKAVLGLREARWADLVQTGFDPDTYVFGQARDTLGAVDGRLQVYMGVGVDAPRSSRDQAVCTPEIVKRSVLAAYRAGAHGVIYGPAYAGMNLTTLDGGAEALRELGVLATPAAATAS
jgi:hypothetical protein